MPNTHAKLVVFDMDDVLWNLNGKVARIANVDPSRLVTFSAVLNPCLTKSERQAMLDAYQDINVFRDIDFDKNVIDLVNQLHRRDDCNVMIVSNSASREIADVKRQQLSRVLDIPNENIVLNVIAMEDSTKKELPSDIYLFVDDSPHNILISNARHCIMPAKTWNDVLFNGCLDGIPVLRPMSDKELRETILDCLG